MEVLPIEGRSMMEQTCEVQAVFHLENPTIC